MVESLAPYGSALGDHQAQESLSGRRGRRGHQLMGDAQHALEEIRAFDRLAKDDLFPTRMELGILLDVSAVELEELLVLVVPVRAALARLQVLEMLSPRVRKDFVIGAVMLEEVDRRVRQALLTLARLLEDEVDAVLLPFKLRHIPSDCVIAHGGIDKCLQGGLRCRVDRPAVFDQALPHFFGVNRLAIGALLSQ